MSMYAIIEIRNLLHILVIFRIFLISMVAINSHVVYDCTSNKTDFENLYTGKNLINIPTIQREIEGLLTNFIINNTIG